MSKMKITKVDVLAKTNFVSLYNIGYKNKVGNDKSWVVASRKSKEELENLYLENKKDEVDAVVLIAYHKTYEKLVIIKQFRVPINNYIYELPAGLVDNNESIEVCTKRELKEETGLDLVEINYEKSKMMMYPSPGMSNESIAFIYLTCDGEVSDKYLEEDEDIETVLVSRKRAREIINSNENIDAKTYLVLELFAQIGEKLFI